MAKIGRDGDPITRSEQLKARGRFQIKTWKGRPYVSKWPAPRGNKKSKVQAAWQAHFAYVSCLSKIPDPRTFDSAVALAKGTGWYYRDVVASAAVGKLWRSESGLRIVTPTAQVHRTVAEALTSGVDKTLTPTVMDWDNNVFWSASINPTRLTFRSAGLYLVGAEVAWNSVTLGRRNCTIKKNGTTFVAVNSLVPGSAQAVSTEVQRLVPFQAGDYIECVVSANVASVTALLSALWVMAITPEQVT